MKKKITIDFNILTIIGMILPALGILIDMEVLLLPLLFGGLICFAIGYKRFTSIVYPMIFMLIYLQAYCWTVNLWYLKYIILGLLVMRSAIVLVRKIELNKFDLLFNYGMIILFLMSLLWEMLGLNSLINFKILLIVISLSIIGYGLFKLRVAKKGFGNLLTGILILSFMCSQLLFILHRLTDFNLYELSEILSRLSLMLFVVWGVIMLIIRVMQIKTNANKL